MIRKLFLAILCVTSLTAQAALDATQVARLAADDSSDKVAAIRQLTQTADPDAVRVLKAMAEDKLFVAAGRVVIIDGEQAFDGATGTAIKRKRSINHALSR
jgi:urea transport system permease protein